MLKNPRERVGITGVAVLLLIALLLGTLLVIGVGENVEAAPPAALTPVVTGYSNDAVEAPINMLSGGTVITQDTNTSSFIMAEAEALDIHWTIDQDATATNTITITLQHANDNTNFFDGAVVLSGSSADVNSGNQFVNGMYRTRLELDVANTNTLTITQLSILPKR